MNVIYSTSIKWRGRRGMDEPTTYI